MGYFSGDTYDFKKVNDVWICKKDQARAKPFKENGRLYMECTKCYRSEQVYGEGGERFDDLES
jgi:hypothetical protein